jgi:pimeloyl-ACP methyl ester carboxylesterase
MDAEGNSERTTGEVVPTLAPWPLPGGRYVTLERGDVTFVRDTGGPPGLPVLLLLHGWTATADLNFFAAYPRLARSWRVIALDHRGHGRGLRSIDRFTLEDCADDAIAVLDALGIRNAVAVGYSMGGPIALLAARRHPERIDGLVLCATSSSFARTHRESARFRLLSGLSSACHVARAQSVQRLAAALVGVRGGPRRFQDWVVDELSRHDWLTVLDAGCAIGRFSADPWLAETRKVTAVVAMLHDRVVPTSRQLRLAHDIPGATLHTVAAGHSVCVAAPERFVAALVEACGSVRARLERPALVAA